MRQATQLLFVLVTLISCNSKVENKTEYVKYVDPLIGTSWKSNAGCIPSVTAPFGMVHFVAATDENEIGMVPFHYENKDIIGFMATHQPAPWMGDYGYLSFWPSLNEVKLKPETRKLSYSHYDNISTPYYYSVNMRDNDSNIVVSTEITSTQRCGFFKFDFQSNKKPFLVFEMSKQKGMQTRMMEFGSKPQKYLDYIDDTRHDTFEGFVKVDTINNEIVGYNPDRHSYHLGPELKNFKGYFVIKFDKDINEFGTWTDSIINENTTETKGDHIGAFISFDLTQNETVGVKIATSFISLAQARENLEKEIPHWDFEKTKEELKNIWEQRLKVIELIKATEEQKNYILYLSLSFITLSANIFRIW